MPDNDIYPEHHPFSIPHYPRNLSGSFWGITTYYNPCRYKRRVENYKKFRMASAKQGLKLVCVELTFGNSGYELDKEDAEIMVRLRTKDVLWQKERLLNVGLNYLPKDCDKIAWLDADIIFLNDQWIEETSRLLNDYVVVQPFSNLIRLPKDVYDIHSRRGLGEECKYHSIAYEIYHSDGKLLLSRSLWGVPGFVWAIRRSAIERCGFYDRHILGTNDTVLAYALFGQVWPRAESTCPVEMITDMREWIQKIYAEVQGSVIYRRDVIVHLWHGNSHDRMYQVRNEYLKEFNFNPCDDIKLDQNGCWQWASFKPMLHLYTRLYFYLRNEDGTVRGKFLAGSIMFLLRCLRCLLQFPSQAMNAFILMRKKT